ncbi:MAG: DNA cytosine methyltransferase [Geitlerinemataceae cyanobacterium]
MTRPIAVDIFAGAGGLSLGLEQAGFDVVAAIEVDPVHCAVHEFNFPDCAVICRSAADVTGAEIRAALAEQGNDRDAEIDLVCGGPPCQGFSLMGKRVLDDPRNALASHFLRLVRELQPKYFVMENVKGMAIGKHRQFLREAIEACAAMGYRVVEPYQVLNAACYGVPQHRERLFLLGAREGLPLPNYPEPISQPAGRKPKKSAAKSKKSAAKTPNSPTVRDAIGDIPDADKFRGLLDRDAIAAELGAPSDYARTLRDPSGEPGNFAYMRHFDPGLLTDSLRTNHSAKSIARFKKTEPGHKEPVSRFHKLDPDGVSNTLRAGTPSTRGAFTSPRPIHYGPPRCITIREAARLHSYPDWFRFHATKWHGGRQIGNSVPPRLGRAVGGAIVEALGVTPSRPTRAIVPGDKALLTLTMTHAAARYGVSPDVVPQRDRVK